MLAALWLGRLEKELTRQLPTAPPARQLAGRAGVVTIPALPPAGTPDPLVQLGRRPVGRRAEPVPTGLHTQPRHAVPAFAVGLADREEWTLPTRIHGHAPINPQFTATRHGNRV